MFYVDEIESKFRVFCNTKIIHKQITYESLFCVRVCVCGVYNG